MCTSAYSATGRRASRRAASFSTSASVHTMGEHHSSAAKGQNITSYMRQEEGEGIGIEVKGVRDNTSIGVEWSAGARTSMYQQSAHAHRTSECRNIEVASRHDVLSTESAIHYTSSRWRQCENNELIRVETYENDACAPHCVECWRERDSRFEAERTKWKANERGGPIASLYSLLSKYTSKCEERYAQVETWSDLRGDMKVTGMYERVK